MGRGSGNPTPCPSVVLRPTRLARTREFHWTANGFGRFHCLTFRIEKHCYWSLKRVLIEQNKNQSLPRTTAMFLFSLPPQTSRFSWEPFLLEIFYTTWEEPETSRIIVYVRYNCTLLKYQQQLVNSLLRTLLVIAPQILTPRLRYARDALWIRGTGVTFLISPCWYQSNQTLHHVWPFQLVTNFTIIISCANSYMRNNWEKSKFILLVNCVGKKGIAPSRESRYDKAYYHRLRESLH